MSRKPQVYWGPRSISKAHSAVYAAPFPGVSTPNGQSYEQRRKWIEKCLVRCNSPTKGIGKNATKTLTRGATSPALAAKINEESSVTRKKKKINNDKLIRYTYVKYLNGCLIANEIGV